MTLEYEKFGNTVNTGIDDNITIFVSDWNKDHWAFYAHINLDQYEDDINDIHGLIKKLNWRDGDVYIEMVDYDGEMEYFYSCVYDMGYFDNWDIMNTDLWEIGEENDDELFQVAKCVLGTVDKDSIKELAEDGYILCEDYDDLLEHIDPELYKLIDDKGVWHCFTSEYYFNGWSNVNRCKLGIIYTYE